MKWSKNKDILLKNLIEDKAHIISILSELKCSLFFLQKKINELNISYEIDFEYLHKHTCFKD